MRNSARFSQRMSGVSTNPNLYKTLYDSAENNRGFWSALTGWAVIPLALVISTFVVGLLFTRVPNAHAHESKDALHHGEILPRVDISRSRGAEIEELVHHRHPEAVIGGVGWASKTLHV